MSGLAPDPFIRLSAKPNKPRFVPYVLCARCVCFKARTCMGTAGGRKEIDMHHFLRLAIIGASVLIILAFAGMVYDFAGGVHDGRWSGHGQYAPGLQDVHCRMSQVYEGLASCSSRGCKNSSGTKVKMSRHACGSGRTTEPHTGPCTRCTLSCTLSCVCVHVRPGEPNGAALHSSAGCESSGCYGHNSSDG